MTNYKTIANMATLAEASYADLSGNLFDALTPRYDAPNRMLPT